jgi:hypothetical protein
MDNIIFDLPDMEFTAPDSENVNHCHANREEKIRTGNCGSFLLNIKVMRTM